MFKIRQEQLEAFRLPMRSTTPARLLGEVKAHGFGVEQASSQDGKPGELTVGDARGRQTRLSFHHDGLPAKLVTTCGSEHRFEHDRQGRLSAITYPGAERVEMRRDEAGNVRKLIRPGLLSHSLDYDARGNLTTAIYPDGTFEQLAYDANGRLISLTDRSDAKTIFHRDDAGKLRAISDPLGRRIVYETDETDALEAVVFPDGSREEYAFNPELNVAVMTRRDGREVVMELNEDGALSAIIWPDGSLVEFDFDRSGNLAAAGNATETIRHTFDNHGIPLTEETSAGVVQYRYDAEGRLIELVTPYGDKIGYDYDADGRLSIIRDWQGRENRFVYAVNNTIGEIHYGNGLVEEQSYARVGRLAHARVIDGQGQVLSEQRYEYDLCERLTGIAEFIGGAPQPVSERKLKYDAESRLRQEVNVATGRPPALFSYDDKGNLIHDDGTPIVIGAMDEPRRVGRYQIEYDQLGNMLRLPGSQGEIECEYNEDGTLAITRIGDKEIRYEYDAFSRRILKSDGLATTRYGWAEQQLLWEEFQANPDAKPIRRDYIFVPDGIAPIAFREAGRSYWLQSDARGAVVRAFDDAGQVVWQASYDSFGHSLIEIEEVRQPLRLIGQYCDEETGLHYNFARYYSPYLKSYLSRDPAWHQAGATNYSYSRNDPWNRVDPFGAIAPLLIAAGAVALGGAVGAGIGAALAWATGGDPVAGAVEGGIAGVGTVLGGLLGGPVGLVVGGIAGDVVGAFAADLTEQARKGEPLCWSCALKAAGIALGIDLALLGLGRIPALRRLIQAAGKKLYKLGAPLRKWASRNLERLLKKLRQPFTRKAAREAENKVAKVIVKESKWDYFFGRVKSNPHNEARSLQNLQDLKKLGIEESKGGREKLTGIFEEGLKNPEKARHASDYGTTVTKTVGVPPNGAIDVKYFYPDHDMTATPEISTIIPKIY